MIFHSTAAAQLSSNQHLHSSIRTTNQTGCMFLNGCSPCSKFHQLRCRQGGPFSCAALEFLSRKMQVHSVLNSFSDLARGIMRSMCRSIQRRLDRQYCRHAWHEPHKGSRHLAYEWLGKERSNGASILPQIDSVASALYLITPISYTAKTVVVLHGLMGYRRNWCVSNLIPLKRHPCAALCAKLQLIGYHFIKV
jgi:hypothetical protein